MVKKRINLDNEDLWNIVTKTIIQKKSDKISPVNFLIGDMNKKINKSEFKKKNKKAKNLKMHYAVTCHVNLI